VWQVGHSGNNEIATTPRNSANRSFVRTVSISAKRANAFVSNSASVDQCQSRGMKPSPTVSLTPLTPPVRDTTWHYFTAPQLVARYVGALADLRHNARQRGGVLALLAIEPRPRHRGVQVAEGGRRPVRVTSDAPCHDRGEQPPSHERRVDQRTAADNAARDLNGKGISYSEQSAPPSYDVLHKQPHNLGPPPSQTVALETAESRCAATPNRPDIDRIADRLTRLGRPLSSQL
jgi:hypothetical protein